MLKNNYLTFGNSIMQKYSGMTSRINPLALIFLQTQEEEEQPPVKPVSVTNVRNYFYRTNHYMYNHVVNRYVQNYNQIVSLLQSNTLYAGSPNFKMDIHPVQLSHTQVQTEEQLETVIKQTTEHLLKEYVRVEKMQEKTTEVIIKQFAQEMSSDSLKVLPLKIREKVYAQISREVQEKVLPMVYKQTEHTTLTQEAAKVLQESVRTVIEQNAGRLPKPAVGEITAKMTQELTVYLKKELETASVQQQIQQTTHEQSDNRKDIIRNILVKQIEPYIMAMSPGTSRSVIHQEILKVCQKEESLRILTEVLERTDRLTENAPNTIEIRETIRSLMLKIVEHTDTCRRGKEKYERQIVSRLTPLPVRPVHLEFRTEKPETEEAKQVQQTQQIQQAQQMQLTQQMQQRIKQESRVVQQKIVQVYKKEQTAESKYYTHFIDKFLKKTKEQMITEVDRRELPAGIIYHQKPKETVRFVNKDIIRLPLDMLPQPQQDGGQGLSVNKPDAVYGRKIQELRTVENEIINQIHNNVKNEIVNKTTEEVVHQIEEHISDYPEYTQRRVIRRAVPDFTVQQIKVTGKGETFIPQSQSVLEPTVSYNTGRLELTLLVHEESEASPVNSVSTQNSAGHGSDQGMAQYVRTYVSGHESVMGNDMIHAPVQGAAMGSNPIHVPEQGAVTQDNIIHVPEQRSIFRDVMTYTSEHEAIARNNAEHMGSNMPLAIENVAPVALLHKREESSGNEKRERELSQTSGKSETIQQDIVFTKDIVTKQNIENVITEHVNKQQEIMAVGQASNEAGASQNPVVAGQSAGQQAGLVSTVKVEQMISESVSRHVDESIHEISRQVYRTLERQIKKEQERRGL